MKTETTTTGAWGTTSPEAWSTAGRNTFETLGLPTSRTEAYKYTPLKTLLPGALSFFTEETQSPVRQTADPGLSPYVLRFCDGRLTDISDALRQHPDVTIAPNTDINRSALLGEWLSLPDIGNDPLYALAKTGWYKGVHLHLKKNAQLNAPIVILQDYSKVYSCHSAFNFMTVGENARLELLEINENSSNHYSNIASLLLLRDSAKVAYHLLHTATGLHGIRSIQAHLAKNAFLTVNSFALQNALLRINIKVALEGEGAQADLHGLYQTLGTQHIDHQVEIRHLLPHCPSNQLFKGMLGGESTGVFNGKIFVARDAQKTNAFQNSKALLLSEDARVYTKPELEIFADDVKCSHGAAVGQMNEDELFYLLARGLSKAEALQLLLNAYAAEVIAKVEHETVRQWMENHIRAVLNPDHV